MTVPHHPDGGLNLAANASKSRSQGLLLCRTCRFFLNVSRNHHRYSLCLLVKGWPGWVGLSGEMVDLLEGCHPSHYQLGSMHSNFIDQDQSIQHAKPSNQRQNWKQNILQLRTLLRLFSFFIQAYWPLFNQSINQNTFVKRHKSRANRRLSGSYSAPEIQVFSKVS